MGGPDELADWRAPRCAGRRGRLAARGGGGAPLRSLDAADISAVEGGALYHACVELSIGPTPAAAAAAVA